MIQYGRAKHFSKVKLQDHQKHLIWTSAHDERHDEEWEKPIVGASDVSQEIIDCPVVVPIITLRVDGTDLFGTGWYLHKDRELFAIAVWHEERWKDLIYGRAFKPPAVFISVPSILGEKDVRFTWDDPKHDKAFRIS
jgi:hypothetical protein